MQSGYRTNCVKCVIDILFCKAKVPAVPFEHGLVFEDQRHGQVRSPASVSYLAEKSMGSAAAGAHGCYQDVCIDNNLIGGYRHYILPRLGSFSTSGTQKRKRAPPPGALVASMPPPWASRMARVMANPMPEPLRPPVPRLPR
jgi:hypothetical protein